MPFLPSAEPSPLALVSSSSPATQDTAAPSLVRLVSRELPPLAIDDLSKPTTSNATTIRANALSASKDKRGLWHALRGAFDADEDASSLDGRLTAGHLLWSSSEADHVAVHDTKRTFAPAAPPSLARLDDWARHGAHTTTTRAIYRPVHVSEDGSADELSESIELTLDEGVLTSIERVRAKTIDVAVPAAQYDYRVELRQREHVRDRAVLAQINAPRVGTSASTSSAATASAAIEHLPAFLSVPLKGTASSKGHKASAEHEQRTFALVSHADVRGATVQPAHEGAVPVVLERATDACHGAFSGSSISFDTATTGKATAVQDASTARGGKLAALRAREDELESSMTRAIAWFERAAHAPPAPLELVDKAPQQSDPLPFGDAYDDATTPFFAGSP